MISSYPVGVRKSIHSPEQKVFQTLLKEIRQEAGLLQTDLAERLERPQAFVSRYEVGEKMLDIPELLQICRVLGTDLVTLMTRYQAILEAKGLWEPNS
jgi:transcriptional regulator with XRE-family HTH domain